jgi:hypothetical protein
LRVSFRESADYGLICVNESTVGLRGIIQHIQKAFIEMNLRLRHVVSDITGA